MTLVMNSICCRVRRKRIDKRGRIGKEANIVEYCRSDDSQAVL